MFNEPPTKRLPRDRHLVVVLTTLLCVAGCQGAPSPVVPVADLTFPDVISAELPEVPPMCEVDADCPTAQDCCLEVACVAQQCVYDVLSECCTVVGPCAAASSLHQGVCTATCEPGGCEGLLRLPEANCGDTIATLLPNEQAPAVSIDRRGISEGLGWHFDLRAPYALSPTWRLTDARCDALHNGPLTADCAPLGQDAEAFYADLTFGPVALPAGRVAIVEAIVSGGPPQGIGDSSAPIVTLEVLFPTGAVAVVWRSSDEPAADVSEADAPGSWRAIAGDLSAYGGQEVQLRVAISASAGPRRSDRGFGLASLVVRAPCASERSAADVRPCEDSVAMRVQSSDDVLYTTINTDPDGSCIACDGSTDCPAGPSCVAHACHDGYCARDASTSTCCGGPDAEGPAWLEALAQWTTTEVAWVEAPDPSGDGGRTFHFPLAGQPGIPRGEMLSPAFYVPPGEVTLAFDVWLETEWDDASTAPSSTRVDVLRVELRSERDTGTMAWPLWDSTLIGGSTRGNWRRVTLPLRMASGSTTAIAWSFDAGDPDFNDYGGAWIRHISIGPDCAESSTLP